MTVKLVRAVNEPGFYGDGNTLFLRVAPGGSKQWVQRLTVRGRRRNIGLGGVRWVTLAEAREAAYENRRVARRGGDPLEARRKPKTPLFRDAARSTCDSLRPRWRNEKVAANWMQQLERHALERLGDLPVDRIGREDILAVLKPIWSAKPETARRVRRCIKATLQWCQAHGLVFSRRPRPGADFGQGEPRGGNRPQRKSGPKRDYPGSSRAAALKNRALFGQDEDSSNRTRRVFRNTTAPILSSFSRTVPTWARARSLSARAIRRVDSNSTQAREESSSRYWLDHHSLQLARSADRSSCWSLIRFSMSPRAQYILSYSRCGAPSRLVTI